MEYDTESAIRRMREFPSGLCQGADGYLLNSTTSVEQMVRYKRTLDII
jgi:hypothetical protein